MGLLDWILKRKSRRELDTVELLCGFANLVAQQPEKVEITEDVAAMVLRGWLACYNDLSEAQRALVGFTLEVGTVCSSPEAVLEARIVPTPEPNGKAIITRRRTK